MRTPPPLMTLSFLLCDIKSLFWFILFKLVYEHEHQIILTFLFKYTMVDICTRFI